MKIINLKFTILFVLIFIGTNRICLSQQLSGYSITKPDGTSLGTYVIEDDAYFIRGKAGKLNFYLTDPSALVKLDPEVPDMICGGNKLSWTPPKSKISEIITITITKNGAELATKLPLSLPIRPNQPPKYIFGTNKYDLPVTVGSSVIFKATDFVKDDDQDQLTFNWITKPQNFPDIDKNDGTFSLSNAFKVPVGKTSDAGVIGITDGLIPITFIVNITYNPPNDIPPLFTVSASGGSIDLGKFSEEDLINYSISAYDAYDKENKITYLLVGNPFGLTYSNGKLGGQIGNDAVPDYTDDSQIDLYQTKEFVLRATSVVTNLSSEIKFTFQVKNTPSQKQKDKYTNFKARVDAKIPQYRAEALAKWSIIWSDVQKIKRNDEVVSAINQTLSTSGGIAAVFGPGATITAITSGLSLVSGIISSNLKDKEKQVGANVQTLQNSISGIEKIISSFLDSYPGDPSKDQKLLTVFGLNKMEKDCISVETNFFTFQQAIAGILQVKK